MLYETLVNDMKNAMKNKDKETLSTIRLLKSAIDLEAKNKHIEINDELVIEVTVRQVKTHKASIIEFDKAGRNDLSNKLKNEIKLLERYLPEQLNEEEVNDIIDSVFSEVKPESKKDMGKIMKELNIKLKGKTDMKNVSKIVNDKLNNLN